MGLGHRRGCGHTALAQVSFALWGAGLQEPCLAQVVPGGWGVYKVLGVPQTHGVCAELGWAGGENTRPFSHLSCISMWTKIYKLKKNFPKVSSE